MTSKDTDMATTAQAILQRIFEDGWWRGGDLNNYLPTLTNEGKCYITRLWIRSAATTPDQLELQLEFNDGSQLLVKELA